jgi:hypothetical protein
MVSRSLLGFFFIKSPEFPKEVSQGDIPARGFRLYFDSQLRWQAEAHDLAIASLFASPTGIFLGHDYPMVDLSTAKTTARDGRIANHE